MLIVVGTIVGSFLLACVGCGVFVFLLPSTTYAAPWDPCAEVAAAPVGGLGTVTGQAPAQDTAMPGCTLMFAEGGAVRSLKVLLATPASASEATAHYDTAKAAADAAGATVADVSGVWTDGFSASTNGDAGLTYDLHVRDANLYARLTVVADRGVSAAKVRGQLVAVVEHLLPVLKEED